MSQLLELPCHKRSASAIWTFGQYSKSIRLLRKRRTFSLLMPFLIIFYLKPAQTLPITSNANKTLNEFHVYAESELRQLRDFVRLRRSRGRGSVSRVAYDAENGDVPDLDLLADSGKIQKSEGHSRDDAAGNIVVLRPPKLSMQIVMPSIGTKPKNQKSHALEESGYNLENNEGLLSKELGEQDYEKLAQILQTFVTRRKNITVTTTMTTTPMAYTTTNEKMANKSFLMKKFDLDETTAGEVNSSHIERQLNVTGKINSVDQVKVKSLQPILRPSGDGSFLINKEKFIGRSTVTEQTQAEKKELAYYVLSNSEVGSTTTQRGPIWSGTAEKILLSNKVEENGNKIAPSSAMKKIIELPLTIRPQIHGRVVIQKDDNVKQNSGTDEHDLKIKEPDRKKIDPIGTDIRKTLLVGVQASSDRRKEKLKANNDFELHGKLESDSLKADSSQKEMIAITMLKQPTDVKKVEVTVLREGLARQSDNGEYTFVASITLIRDTGKVILVDTGLGTDINGRTDLIKKLAQLNIAPPRVDFVVTTHGHPDHSGNTNDFPDSQHFQGNTVHYRTKFNFSDLFENDMHQLSPNVELIKTPGHTSEDISVIVRNSGRPHNGTVAVVGDLFMAEDVDFPMMWRPLAWNETSQEIQRRRLLCMADLIVPGHGKMFRVTSEIRTRTNCPPKELPHYLDAYH